ncbi:MAG TPA: flagellar hook-associated protein FlgL [Burkholderiaceae bacterium]|nr:flagellar hook-associated protein FlgL [Burkholderiaceae bacterium]
MATNSFLRLGSANTYENALRNLNARHAGLAGLQENLSSGKRVLRPSDDPTAAAQAERALTRISRIQTEQRALELQRNTLALSESTLADANGLLQNFRDLAVAAGNGANSPRERETLAAQMTAVREQIFALANRKDTNGMPLFSGLGSTGTPFETSIDGVAPDPDYAFNGLPGQISATETSVPFTMDGRGTWMDVIETNGVFGVALGAANTGKAYSDVGQVTNPAALTGDDYTIQFTVTGTTVTYDVVNNTTATTVLSALPYKAGQAIQFDGISLTVKGVPNNGDTLVLTPNDPNPANRPSVFGVLDRAIAGLFNPGTSTGADSTSANFNHELAISLAQIDTSLEKLQRSRSQAGDLLNRADRISDNQELRNVQLEDDRSKAEDLDMIKGLSDFQNQQTGYEAALKSYAQIQKLSLFNFIG